MNDSRASAVLAGVDQGTQVVVVSIELLQLLWSLGEPLRAGFWLLALDGLTADGALVGVGVRS